MSGLTVCGSLSKYPVSLGRTMHLAGYEALGLPFTYVPFACRDVEGALRGMRALSIRGMGVSMPFKLEVMPFLDAIDPLAARIGAVNTIVNDDGRLTGFNTDAAGAVAAVREQTAIGGKRALVLGAGGAARAVAFGLADAGARVTIRNRTRDKAVKLAAIVPNASADEVRAGDVDIVVNASSVGMSDVDPRSPLAASELRPGLVILDAVYKPLETELLRTARAAGAVAISGARMLLHQAMGQFRLYTGRDAPEAAMDRALKAAIG